MPSTRLFLRYILLSRTISEIRLAEIATISTHGRDAFEASGIISYVAFNASYSHGNRNHNTYVALRQIIVTQRAGTICVPVDSVILKPRTLPSWRIA